MNRLAKSDFDKMLKEIINTQLLSGGGFFWEHEIKGRFRIRITVDRIA